MHKEHYSSKHGLSPISKRIEIKSVSMIYHISRCIIKLVYLKSQGDLSFGAEGVLQWVYEVFRHDVDHDPKPKLNA